MPHSSPPHISHSPPISRRDPVLRGHELHLEYESVGLLCFHWMDKTSLRPPVPLLAASGRAPILGLQQQGVLTHGLVSVREGIPGRGHAHFERPRASSGLHTTGPWGFRGLGTDSSAGQTPSLSSSKVAPASSRINIYCLTSGRMRPRPATSGRRGAPNCQGKGKRF